MLLTILASIGIATAAYCQTSQEGIHLALTPYAEMYQETTQAPAKKTTQLVPAAKPNCQPDTCRMTPPKCNFTSPEKSKDIKKP
ncbi:MAG: hypothetical protein R3D00_14815 [Bacteroidia bacterium]